MKNCGVSILEISNKEDALRFSLLVIWSEKSAYFNYGRSLFAVEKYKQKIIIDLCFIWFSFDLCQ